LGDLDRHLMHGSLGPPESIFQSASRSVGLCSRFCTAHERDQQTNRDTDRPTYIHTDHATPSIATDCISLLLQCSLIKKFASSNLAAHAYIV